jgi:TonB family protein
MSRYVIAFLLVFLPGCGPSYEISHDIEPPELIGYVPLPSFHTLPGNRALKLKILVCVREDGTVEHARLVQSSGDASWDTLAEQSILQWRYAPPLRNGVPTAVWVNQQVVVQFDEPVMVSLVQLSTPSKSQADSLYALLLNGVEFERLVREFAGTSPGQRGGSLGTVDIRLFAPRVREALKELQEGEYTHPLRSGDGYVIYKRLRYVAS